MIAILRDVVVGICALVVVFLGAALGQGAVEYGAPSFSDYRFGGTNIGTYALFAILSCLYFLAGVVVPRWLRTSMPLVWLVSPIVAVYVLLLFAAPSPFRCNPIVFFGCWIVLAPFFVSALAVSFGFFFQRRRSRASV
jgi:hypothetical protein